MDRQTYRVTDKAGPRVNGQRVWPGQTLSLTAAEARYHLDLLELKLVPESAGRSASPGKR